MEILDGRLMDTPQKIIISIEPLVRGGYILVLQSLSGMGIRNNFYCADKQAIEDKIKEQNAVRRHELPSPSGD